jgi:hypothetical protein
MSEINFFSLCLAILTVAISILQWSNNAWKRKNALFDRRYDFFIKVQSWWISVNTHPTEQYDIDDEDLIPFAIEAEFLFGKDIMNHILSLNKMPFSGTSWFASDNFIDPFRKYLKLR